LPRPPTLLHPAERRWSRSTRSCELSYRCHCSRGEQFLRVRWFWTGIRPTRIDPSHMVWCGLVPRFRQVETEPCTQLGSPQYFSLTTNQLPVLFYQKRPAPTAHQPTAQAGDERRGTRPFLLITSRSDNGWESEYWLVGTKLN
jgi:hypothetical protein